MGDAAMDGAEPEDGATAVNSSSLSGAKAAAAVRRRTGIEMECVAPAAAGLSAREEPAEEQRRATGRKERKPRSKSVWPAKRSSTRSIREAMLRVRSWYCLRASRYYRAETAGGGLWDVCLLRTATWSCVCSRRRVLCLCSGSRRRVFAHQTEDVVAQPRLHCAEVVLHHGSSRWLVDAVRHRRGRSKSGWSESGGGATSRWISQDTWDIETALPPPPTLRKFHPWVSCRRAWALPADLT